MTTTANITNPCTSLSIMAGTPLGAAKNSAYPRQRKEAIGPVTVTVRMPPYRVAIRDVTA